MHFDHERMKFRIDPLGWREHGDIMGLHILKEFVAYLL